METEIEVFESKIARVGWSATHRREDQSMVFFLIPAKSSFLLMDAHKNQLLIPISCTLILGGPNTDLEYVSQVIFLPWRFLYHSALKTGKIVQ